MLQQPPHAMGVPGRCHSRRMGQTLASTGRVDETRSPRRGLELDSSSSLIGRGSIDARRGSIECPAEGLTISAEGRDPRIELTGFENSSKVEGPRDPRAEGLAWRVAIYSNGILDSDFGRSAHPGPCVCRRSSRCAQRTPRMAEHGLVARCHANAVLPGSVPGLHELAGRHWRREQAGVSL